jgi:hypothetical protein
MPDPSCYTPLTTTRGYTGDGTSNERIRSIQTACIFRPAQRTLDASSSPSAISTLHKILRVKMRRRNAEELRGPVATPWTERPLASADNFPSPPSFSRPLD